MITSSFFRRGVTRLLQGLNIILNPATGRGEVEINASGGGGGAVDQIIDGTNTTVSPGTGIGIVSIDADPASNAASGVVPMLTAVDGAVAVDNAAGSLVNRRLTADDIDPAFAITSFARSGYSSPKELGDTIVDPRYTASYNATLTTPLNLLDGTNTDPITQPGAETSFGYNNFNGSGLPARSYVSSTINGTVTHTLSAKKAPGGPVKTAQITDQWQARRFYGIVDVPGAYDEAFIEGLAQNQLASGRSGSYVFAAGTVTTKIYLCWPTAFGNPVTIKDQNGFDFPMTKVATAVPVTNAFAVVVPGGYDVWESDNFITAAFTLTVT